MIADHHYHFEALWQVPCPLPQAFEVLHDVDAYAHWWPQVRRCEPAGEGAHRAAIRSLLPVTLNLLLTAQVADPVEGVLRVGLADDLTGFAQWTLTWEGETTTAAHWTQDVYLTHEHLQRLPVTNRTLLRLNHAHMMRSGEAGLRRWLTRRPTTV